jgi:DNA anti-recombination protein RmuC
MRRVLVVVLVLVVGVGVLGYWRGWFSFTKEGADGKVQVHFDTAQFNKDKEVFGKTVNEKAKVMKDQVASLWKKTEGLTGDDKAQAQKELTELNQKHGRLEKQIKELEDAGRDKFESIKEDLSKSLEEVEKKIADLTKKLEKGKDK